MALNGDSLNATAYAKEAKPLEVQQNLRFQGQYLDRESGLHYNTFRFYDPDIGRFISPDPIGLVGGINFYQYAPNPISWIDPFGLCAAKEVSLTAEQAKNIARFEKGLPANAKESLSVKSLPNEGVAVQGTSPGKVPGSSAVYEKQIDAAGKTIQVTKTTYDPAGNIVHVKDKLNGGVFP